MGLIRVSYCPCKKKAGQVTSGIRSIFLNLSLITYYSSLPAYSRIISLIDIKGLIRIIAHGSREAATNVAGPDPIDLPNTIIWSFDKP